MINTGLHISLLIVFLIHIRPSMLGQDHNQLERSYQEAINLVESGKSATAIPILNGLIKESIGEVFFPMRSKAQLALARIYREDAYYTSALKYYLEADKSYERDTLSAEYLLTHAELGEYFREIGLLDQAISHFTRCYVLAKHAHVDSLIPNYLNKLGYLYLKAPNLDSAQHYIQTSQTLAKKAKDTLRMINALEQLAKLSLQKDDYRASLNHNLQITKLAKAINDPPREASAFNNTGFILFQMGEYQAAIENFSQALSIDQEKKSLLLMAKDLSNIGIAYQALDMNQSAISTLLKSARLYEEAGEEAGLARNYHVISKIYLYQKDYHNAAVYLDKAFDLVRKSDGKLVEIAIELNETASTMAQERNDYERALVYNQQYLHLKDSITIASTLIENNRQKEIANLRKTQEDLRKIIAEQQVQELRYNQLELEKEKQVQKIVLMEQDVQIQASLQREKDFENERALLDLKAERDRLFAESQAGEIQNLQQLQKLQDLELQEKKREEAERSLIIENLEREQALKDSELARIESRRTYFFAVGALLVLLLLMMLIAFFVNRRANKRLQEKNLAIERSRSELADTLNQLKSTQSKLVQSEKMASLGQLTAGIAHEINNPINFISGGISALSRNMDDIKEVLDKYAEITPENASVVLAEIKELKEELEYEEIIDEVDQLSVSISQGATQTASIVKGLRTFSRLDEGNLKLVDLHQNIDSTLIMLQNQYKNRIEIRRVYGSIPKILCYPGKLNQVFMNILANAIQAITDKGWIQIETQTEGEWVTVKIQDNGKGMPQEVQQRIFDPFFTTKDVGEGTGLGLAISLGILQDHNAEIAVESKEGHGTIFLIKLPINQ